MTPTSEMRAAAEKAIAAEKANNDRGTRETWIETLRADDDFQVTANPANVLALLDEVEALRARVEKLERENARLVEDVEIHRTARARNFDLYQAAEASRDALAAEVERLRSGLTEAIDVFDGMMDDEISADLLPRLRALLTPAAEKV